MAYPSALDLAIANAALDRLSEASISAFTENSRPARAVARIYPQTRNLMFSAVDWSFATARAALVGQVVGVYPWAFEYLKPAGVARCRMVLPLAASTDGIGLDPQPFEEGVSLRLGAFVGVIRTDLAMPVLVYTALLADQPELWDAGFVSALTVQLAAELALPVTGNGQIAQALRQQAAQAIGAISPQSQVQSVTSAGRGPSTTTAARG